MGVGGNGYHLVLKKCRRNEMEAGTRRHTEEPCPWFANWQLAKMILCAPHSEHESG